MALLHRLPRDSRLPVAFLIHLSSANTRPSPSAFSRGHSIPLLSLLQARTAAGYAGAKKPNNIWKQAPPSKGPSQSSSQNDSNDHRHRKQKTEMSKKSQRSKQEGVNHRDGNGSHPKLRGTERDLPEVKLSKTLSWILRHGGAYEGLAMREDGFVYVSDILKHSRLRTFGLTLERLKGIVQTDPKQRFSLVFERSDATRLNYTVVEGNEDENGMWLIKANQGHSISAVKIELESILQVSDIPSGLAVHGTTRSAWNVIEKEGLSKMNRNHIHMAQGVGKDDVISGMRQSSQILIFINVQKALDAGIKFYLSDNGVVLTDGDEHGYLKMEFIDRVEDARTRKAIEGWEGSGETVG
ncbi:hypothetical protein Agabi119p4_6665 [Agaricus bisporus var. burnettii]|uniref:2'-phosphotransferase n=1 Tax=Agaricus bisporus var. burnettii TaxID=192524 RepID=A0A8H7EZV1_AGABI|nr:hypothetical protein Agabi119p4_6665 [Agaricus bisporus var. burnettii]